MRKRFINEGLQGFTEHQALELLLFYCIPRRDTNEIAHRFLDEYGSLSNLFEADCMDLQKKLKISENVAVLLTLIPHLSEKYMTSRWSGRPKISCVSEAGNYCRSLFKSRKYETFMILCLDTGKKLIASSVVGEGGPDEVHVYPRNIVEAAIRFQAVSVILAHNHPGGTLAPSFSDIELTKRISEALETVGIAVSDHIIVCGDEYFSFARDGLIKIEK